MSPIVRLQRAINLWFASGVIFGFLFIAVSNWFGFLIVVSFVATTVNIYRIKCPKCGTPVTRGKEGDLFTYKFPENEQCNTCGHALGQEANDRKLD